MKQIIEKFNDTRVLVYGDFVVDEFLFGDIDRISREAPVFIVSHKKSEFRPGCAANAVANLATLGATVLPCGCIGDDPAGAHLSGSLEAMNVSTEHLHSIAGAHTPVKTRVIAGVQHSIKQQIVRIDRLNGMAISPELTETLRLEMDDLLKQVDAVMISDYGIGGLQLETAKWLLRQATRASVPVLVDSRYRLDQFAGATAMTPNQPEAEALCSTLLNATEKLHACGAQLRDRLNLEALVITRGPDGMSVFTDEGITDIPAFGDEEVVDVTGAGDTVIAACTLGVAAGATFTQAATLANLAGGLSVRKKGTATVSRKELQQAVETSGV